MLPRPSVSRGGAPTSSVTRFPRGLISLGLILVLLLAGRALTFRSSYRSVPPSAPLNRPLVEREVTVVQSPSPNPSPPDHLDAAAEEAAVDPNLVREEGSTAAADTSVQNQNDSNENSSTVAQDMTLDAQALSTDPPLPPAKTGEPDPATGGEDSYVSGPLVAEVPPSGDRATPQPAVDARLVDPDAGPAGADIPVRVAEPGAPMAAASI